MGFKGVIITDSLEMEGVNQGYKKEDLPVRLIRAGVDIFLMPKDLDKMYSIESIKKPPVPQAGS